ncbi:hypothetical protein JYU34_013664 [Plutella xylostella]|uniref:Cuticular protein n=1 Tax=Plutella xylostella TaxID=51655 RepID=A0ABQ7QAI4_PLUXY|nr:hypothetical protein JYU34_013664 [Plutella xylostella]
MFRRTIPPPSLPAPCPNYTESAPDRSVEMRWCALILLFTVVTTTFAGPDPKKYKPGTKEKPASTSLTDAERKFLREVEAKFGVKPDVSAETKDTDADKKDDKNDKKDDKKTPTFKPPFPAVIAIEIVNDTDSDKNTGKGKKRTIDANLGYGYRTNNGYTYSYFGNPTQEKGKFMIYPYSQEDIPAANPVKYHESLRASEVEIQPSQAYELVPVKEQDTSYEYKKPSVEFKENIQGLHSPPPAYPEHAHNSETPSSVLYTTYNGHQFSGLQENFPKVMSNYLVDPSQLLQNPQYQSSGLTQDVLHSHGQQLQQRVVPVLVLRIPSSYLKNPSAELYANLPQNYPLSGYLNNVNLQDLVNQYFKKIGYPFAPQIMSYQHTSPVAETQTEASSPEYQPQQYAHPYVQPSYTHSDYSGVQYSAVQPVMAKYPALQNYYKQQYYTSQSQPQYSQPEQHQHYEYRYQYSQPAPPAQPAARPQHNYYVQHYQSQVASQAAAHEAQAQAHGQTYQSAPNADYEASQEQYTSQESDAAYEAPEQHQSQQYESQGDSQEQGYEYGTPKENVELNTGETLPHGDDHTKVAIPEGYEAAKPDTTQYSQEITHEYYTQHQSAQPVVQKETKTITIYPSSSGHATKYIVRPESGTVQSYVYQKHAGDESSSSHSLVISENYPSKDHTQAHTNVFPVGYKNHKSSAEAQQSVSYVTPVPHAGNKYQSKFRIMVPQTVFKSQSEPVSYVNSHSSPMHYLSSANADANSEEEYITSKQHVPPVGSQRPIGYPSNYHSHKRMASKHDSKLESARAKKEQKEKTEQKESA